MPMNVLRGVRERGVITVSEQDASGDEERLQDALPDLRSVTERS